MHKIFISSFAVLLIVLALGNFNYTRAMEPNQVAVGGLVNSRISLDKSTVTLNAREILADPENHPALLSISLFDADSNPLPDLTVQVTSNRGSIDIIEMILDDGHSVSSVSSGKTNYRGQINFRLGSYVPGDAIFSISADATSVNLEDQSLKFLPLPFPGNIEITVPLPPSGEKKIVLVPKTPESQSTTTPAREEAKKLANIGTEIQVPFYIFFLFCLLLIGVPILVAFILINIRKMRVQQKKEMELLELVAAAEHVDQIKNFLSKPA